MEIPCGEMEEAMRIVLVEDEPKSREGIVKIIQHYTEHEIVAAVEDGAAGLEAVERENAESCDFRYPHAWNEWTGNAATDAGTWL